VQLGQNLSEGETKCENYSQY